MIPVRFNPADYFVTEGVDNNAVITLEALVAHPFDFTVTVVTQNGSAIRESCHRLCTSFHIPARVCTLKVVLVQRSPTPLLLYTSNRANIAPT